METVQLLSENEFSRLALRVAQKSNGVTPADVESLNQQIALRKLAEDQDRERLHNERQERIRRENEARPPAPIEAAKPIEWRAFVPNDKAVLLAQFNEQGIATAFQVRAKASSQAMIFPAITHGGPMGALLLAVTECRKIMQG